MFLPPYCTFNTVSTLAPFIARPSSSAAVLIFSIAGYSPADSSLDSDDLRDRFSRFYHFGLIDRLIGIFQYQCKGKITRISFRIHQIYRYIFRICRNGDRRISRDTDALRRITLSASCVEASGSRSGTKAESGDSCVSCLLFFIRYRPAPTAGCMRTRRFRFLSFFCCLSIFFPLTHYSRSTSTFRLLM